MNSNCEQSSDSEQLGAPQLEIWGDMGRYGEIWGAPQLEIWGDMGRYGEIWGAPQLEIPSRVHGVGRGCTRQSLERTRIQPHAYALSCMCVRVPSMGSGTAHSQCGHMRAHSAELIVLRCSEDTAKHRLPAPRLADAAHVGKAFDELGEPRGTSGNLGESRGMCT